MRRILICCLMCFVMLCSCTSLMSELTNTPSYEAQAYSVQYTNEPISKDYKVLVLCDSGDFMFQREVETSMVEAFNENGITAFAYSSIEIESQPPFIDYLYAVAMENDCRYVLIAGAHDFYTYEYGGGISQMSFDSNMADYEASEIVLRVSGAINCEENLYHSMTESIEPACKSMAEAIVDEYMKYAIDSAVVAE